MLFTLYPFPSRTLLAIRSYFCPFVVSLTLDLIPNLLAQYLNPRFLDIAFCKSPLPIESNSLDVGILEMQRDSIDFLISPSIKSSVHLTALFFIGNPVTSDHRSVPPFSEIALESPDIFLALISEFVGILSTPNSFAKLIIASSILFSVHFICIHPFKKEAYRPRHR